MSAPQPYVGLALHAVVSLVIALGMVGVAAWMRYRAKRPPQVRYETYECGEEPFGTARARIPVGFYLIALLFLLFDVEAAFLFPWVRELGNLGILAFWEMVIFLGILLLGWFYALRKGDLRWIR
jgi:NADH-quinone oxidoreductase subunit A